MGRKHNRKRKASVPCPQCRKTIAVSWPEEVLVDYLTVKCPRCPRVYVQVWREVAKDAVRVGPCNSTVIMTGGTPVKPGGPLPGEGVAVPTCDRSDRAHDVKFEGGGFYPTRRLAVDDPRCKAREYHPSLMVTLLVSVMVEGKRRWRVEGPVSFETQFELAGEREKRLEEDGLWESPLDSTVGLATRRAMAVRESKQ